MSAPSATRSSRDVSAVRLRAVVSSASSSVTAKIDGWRQGSVVLPLFCFDYMISAILLRRVSVE